MPSTSTLRIVALAALLAAGARSPLAAANRRVVGWGDSITYGYYDSDGAPGPCWDDFPGNDPPESCGYVKRLDDRLNDTDFNIPIWDIDVLNLGKGGESTGEALSRIDRLAWQCPCAGLASPCPINSLKYWVCNGTVTAEDVVVVLEGTNDITREIGIETIGQNLETLAGKVTALGLNPVLVTVPHRHFYACEDPDNVAVGKLNYGWESWPGIDGFAAANGWPFADIYYRYDHLGGLFNNYYQNFQWMRCDPNNPDPTSGDPLGHPDAQGFDAMSYAGYTYQAYTIEYQVKRALPPRLTLTAPPPPRSAGAPLTFTVSLPDLAQTAALTWSFGDGSSPATTSPAATPATRAHRYYAAGTYTVAITAAHPNGGTRTRSVAVVVTGSTSLIFADGFGNGDDGEWSTVRH